MQCAAKGCKRHCKSLPGDGGIGMKGLCSRHGWWYAACHQNEYAYRCEIVFPLWSAADIAIWLEWCGF